MPVSRKKLMLSDSEDEPVPKKTLLSKGFDESTPNIPRKKLTKTAKTSRSRASITKEDQENNIKYRIKREETEHEDEVSPTPQISEYELQIQKNLAERAKFMESLDIFTAKENLLELTPKPVKPARKTEYRGIAREPKTPVKPTEVRRSLRQRKQTPDGAHLTLPSEKAISQAEASFDEKPSRPSPGPAPMTDYYKLHNEEECQEFVQDLHTISAPKVREGVWSGSVESVLKVMKSMKIEDNLVAKVTPQRTFSIQIHPSLDRTLVLIGAKWGELGIWDVERNDESAGAYYFNVHSRPINCLTLHSTHPEHVYTTSYDGTVRRTDLVAGIMQEVYAYCEPDFYKKYISWHAHQDENCLLVASSEGSACHVDMREPKDSSKKFAVHDRSVKLLAVHPTQNNYFATSSKETVRLWDMRKHKKNSPIAEVEHGRIVTGLEFSPVTGKYLLTTSSDNYLRFLSCDLTTMKIAKKIHHDNQTGRWLTTFKARFVPGREDLIFVGSMKQPRRIEVWDDAGHLRHEFMGESFGSVASINAMHPTRPIIAGANSSGKVHVFMVKS